MLTDLEFGGKRPSQLLRQMRDRAGDKISDALLKSLWLQRLPINIQTSLAISEDHLTRLAQMVDKIAEIYTSTPGNDSVTNRQDHRLSQITILVLTKQVQRLATQVQEQYPPRGRSVSPRRPYFKGRDRSPRSGKEKTCWYHRRFKEKSHKCEPPCSWPSHAGKLNPQISWAADKPGNSPTPSVHSRPEVASAVFSGYWRKHLDHYSGLEE